MRRIVVGLLLVLPALLPSVAEAAFPGANGKITFSRGVNQGAIHVMQPDGSDITQLTTGGVHASEKITAISILSGTVDYVHCCSPQSRPKYSRMSGSSSTMWSVM